MKLVIVVPPSPWLISDRDQPMMGPLYISSYIKKYGHEVQVCDLAGVPEEHWHIPIGDVYGVTGVTPNFPWMKKIIDKLKQREPHKKVIVGGVHATVLPSHILDQTSADVCVIGEGERTMLEIMQYLEMGIECLDQVGGIVTREYTTSPRELLPLDDIPFPDRDSIDYYDYLVPQTYKYLGSEREGSIITSRGCPYKCSYCSSFKIHKGKVRFRSAENVIEELSQMKEKYGMGLCNFVDDNLVLNQKRAYEICRGIKDLDIKWFFLGRVDLVDLDLFKTMVDAGCVSVTYGFESGSNKVLEKIKKRTTIEQAHTAIQVAKEAGLKIRGQFMVGIPGETEKDVEMTAEFIKKETQIDTIGLHVFQPYPGCDVWENPHIYNWQVDKDTDFMSFHTIGKPGVKLTDDSKIQQWYEYLKAVIKNRSIELQD